MFKYVLSLTIVFVFNSTFLFGQHLSKQELKYINKKIKTVELNEFYQGGNWNPFLKNIKDKKIVLLGEPNHGSKEIFLIRNNIIKALNEKAGFDVVLFESGIGELATIELSKESLSGREMTYGLIGGWRTKEFVDLMEYIQSANMSVAGFDVQRSGRSFDKLLRIEAVKIGIDTNRFHDLEQRYTVLKNKLSNRKTVFDSIQHDVLQLINDYKKLNEFFIEEMPQPLEERYLLACRTIFNRISFLEYMLDFVKSKDWNKRWAARDSAMASNIGWLIENIYKDKKLIVVAHNFHISKYNEKEEVMGEFLKEKYEEDMYVLGMFSESGSYLDNYGNKVEMTLPSTEQLDIKHVISALDCKVHYLNIPRKRKKKSNWIFEKIIANDTFIDLSNSNQLVLSKHFDGLLFIDRTSPPDK